MNYTRPLPRRVFLPDWVWALVFLAGILGTCLTDSPWFLVGIWVLLIIQGIFVFHFVRCPTCGGRLTFHQTFIGHSTRYRFQLACPGCRIVWDTGKISDDNTD